MFFVVVDGYTEGITWRWLFSGPVQLCYAWWQSLGPQRGLPGHTAVLLVSVWACLRVNPIVLPVRVSMREDFCPISFKTMFLFLPWEGQRPSPILKPTLTLRFLKESWLFWHICTKQNKIFCKAQNQSVLLYFQIHSIANFCFFCCFFLPWQFQGDFSLMQDCDPSKMCHRLLVSVSVGHLRTADITRLWCHEEQRYLFQANLRVSPPCCFGFVASPNETQQSVGSGRNQQIYSRTALGYHSSLHFPLIIVWMPLTSTSFSFHLSLTSYT